MMLLSRSVGELGSFEEKWSEEGHEPQKQPDGWRSHGKFHEIWQEEDKGGHHVSPWAERRET